MGGAPILGSLYQGSYHFGSILSASDFWKLPYGLIEQYTLHQNKDPQHNSRHMPELSHIGLSERGLLRVIGPHDVNKQDWKYYASGHGWPKAMQYGFFLMPRMYDSGPQNERTNF